MNEWDDVECGDKSGELSDEADVFERFHDDPGAVSTSKRLSVSTRSIDTWVAKRVIPFIQITPRFYLYEFDAVLAAIKMHYQVDARS